MEILRDLVRFRPPAGSGLFKTTFYQRLGIGYEGESGAKNTGFHIVLCGEVFIRAAEMNPPVRLGRGDLIFFVRSFRHDVTFGPAGGVHLKQLSKVPATVGHGSRRVAVLLTGGYSFPDGPPHPIMWDLPAYFVLRAEDMRGDPLLMAVTLAETELAGKTMVEDEELRALLVHLIYRYALTRWLQRNELISWWEGILCDDEIYKVLRAVHDCPEAGWTVAMLARQGGMSRTTFVERFKDRVGESPMHYVSRVRVQRAALLLRETPRRVEQIAREVGYADQFAFSKAFKRVCGVSPRVYRRDAGVKPNRRSPSKAAAKIQALT